MEDLKLKYAEHLKGKLTTITVDDVLELITYDEINEMFLFNMSIDTFVCIEDLKKL